MTIEVDLKEIKTLLSEMSRKLDVLLEEREKAVACEEPLEDEVEAIKEYETAKRKKTIHLVPLSTTAKGT